MVKGTTPNGFEFEIDEQRADDMRFVEALASSKDNPLDFVKAVTLLLGSEQKERLYKFVETEDGRVPTKAFEAEFTAIMKAAKDLKKS